ncbi:MAG: fibronectin type III domain-containing protein, partial [Burkholderiales bacterium]
MSLSWTAPLSDGSSGADSTGYRLYDVGGASAVVLYSGSATAFEQTGLTAGTSYSYEVSAVSAAGESPTTSPLAQYTAPAAPTTLTSSAWTTTSFQIDWVAPTVDASAPAVSGYTLYERVTYEMNDVSTSGAVPDDVLQTMLSESTDTVVVDTVAYDGHGNTAVSTTLSGLTGGASYNYVVAARSDSGEGDRSAALSASTSPPAPGTLASVSQTTTSITLSWSAPVVTTGVAATGYNLYIDDGSTGTPSTLVTCSGAAALDTTCTASGLTGGLTYSFKVSALSSAGESDASSVLAQSTSPAAVAGSMVFSSVTMTSMALTWTAPSGAAPTGYIVYRDDGDDTAMATPSIVAYDGTDSAALTTAVTGLIGGTTYTYMVAALSEAGVGDVSGESTQSTSPATPLGLSSVTQTSTSISLSWSASVVSTGGSAVTSYKVYSNDGTSADAALSATAVHTTTDGTTTTATIDNLSPGLLYGFAVSAVSAAGEGEQSTVLAQSSSPGAPETGPTSSLQTSTSISLSWTAPLSDG